MTKAGELPRLTWLNAVDALLDLRLRLNVLEHRVAELEARVDPTEHSGSAQTVCAVDNP